MSRPYRIDTHQHVVPPGCARWVQDKGIRPGGVRLPVWSQRSAVKFMDSHGVQTGILSLSTPGVYFGDPAEARQQAREVNEYCAGVVAARPDRFGFFATLTLPDVEGALAEARYALDTLRADGIVLLANNGGRYLGDPGFEPLPEFLHRRQSVVFVHPGELPVPAVPGIPPSPQTSCSTPPAPPSASSCPEQWKGSRESRSFWRTRAASSLSSLTESC